MAIAGLAGLVLGIVLGVRYLDRALR